MTNYKSYLATNVLNESKTVSYRLLSRDMKVHGNTAKRMLYDFYYQRNSKVPHSVSACYLVHGTPKIDRPAAVNGSQIHDEDAHMQSSPPMSSLPQQEEEETGIPVKSLTLVREDDLEAVKNTYEDISSIHIYSLSPSPLKNLDIVSDCNRTVTEHFMSEDPLVANKQYGVIQCQGVRRRTARRSTGVAPAVKKPKQAPGPGITPTRNDSGPVAQAVNVSKVSRPSSSGTTQPEDRSDRKAEQSLDSGKKASLKPAIVKREPSNIFKSFAKPKPKLEKEDTTSSVGSGVVSADHSELVDVQDVETSNYSSEDEQEVDLPPVEENVAASKKLRSSRAEELRRMMDVEDEEMEDGAEKPAQQSQDTNPATPAINTLQEVPESLVSISKGRRRGRRRVMRKKTIKDEEGFLVTKSEPAWESFSEDEPPITQENAPMSTSSSSKGRRVGSKPGQGNIMNFFGKK